MELATPKSEYHQQELSMVHKHIKARTYPAQFAYGFFYYSTAATLTAVLFLLVSWGCGGKNGDGTCTQALTSSSFTGFRSASALSPGLTFCDGGKAKGTFGLSIEASDRDARGIFLTGGKSSIGSLVLAWTPFRELELIRKHQTAPCSVMLFACFSAKLKDSTRGDLIRTSQTLVDEEQDGRQDESSGGSVGVHGGNISSHGTDMPPWLSRFSASKTHDSGGEIVDREVNLRSTARAHFDTLSAALKEHRRYPNLSPFSVEAFTDGDIIEVLKAVQLATKGDSRKVVGTCEFLCLLLRVDEEQQQSQILTTRNAIEDSPAVADAIDAELEVIVSGTKYESVENKQQRAEAVLERQRHERDPKWPSSSCNSSSATIIMTRDSLIASAFHYNDCVAARQSGIYKILKRIVNAASTRYLPSADHSSTVLLAPPSYSKIGTSSPLYLDGGLADMDDWSRRREDMKRFGDDVLRIADGAARIKKAEILAGTIVTNLCRATVLPNKEDAESLRGLLLSVMDDWRSLAIRAAACLYRLQGVFSEEQRRLKSSDDDTDCHLDDEIRLTPEINRLAREAFYVYAPLAQRLGMYRLKSDLEEAAFQVLYRRQYLAASALHRHGVLSMTSVASYVTSRVEEVLRSDEVLSEQLELMVITSRVKEPFSMWRKLLKLRMRRNLSKSKISDDASGRTRRGSLSASLAQSLQLSSLLSSSFFSGTAELSLTDVPDAIALRVILRARKLGPDESDEMTRSRERLLCYYVQKVVREIWERFPPTTKEGDGDRVKDYIQYPKPNGYQSLHHTSRVYRHGVVWPFEVQVRSEEMHRVAEYGVAAHWDYKLQPGGGGENGISPVLQDGARTSQLSPDVNECYSSSVRGTVGRKNEGEGNERRVVIHTADNSCGSGGETTAPDVLELSVKSDITTTTGRAQSDNNMKKVTELDKTHGVIADRALLQRGQPLPSLLEGRVESHVRSLTIARDRLVEKSLFIFVSPSSSAVDGQLLRLSAGARVTDALREVKARSGMKFCFDVTGTVEIFRLCRYGRMEEVGLDDALRNGDVLTVPMLKGVGA